MKKRLFVFVMTVCLLVSLCITSSASEAGEKVRVFDDADLLSMLEKDDLEGLLDRISEELNVDVIVSTVDGTDGYGIDRYIELFYDGNDFGVGDTNDGVILMIDMEYGEYRIMANGLCDDAISYDDIDSIGEDIVSYLSDGDYYEAFEMFAEKCEYLIDGHINGFPFKLTQNLLISIGVGLVVALIATLVMKGQLKSVKEQKTANLYTRKGSMNLSVRNDLFLYSNVTRVKIQKPSASAGSSGGSRKIGGGRF